MNDNWTGKAAIVTGGAQGIGKAITLRLLQLSEADHQQHPVGRVGKPEDIANMVLYLASEQAGFITGVNIAIDGGMTHKMIYLEE